MVIRKATLSDLDQLLALIQSTAMQHIDKNVYQWNDPCDINELREEINKGEVFLLLEKNRLVGTYSIRRPDHFYPVQIEKSYYLYRLVIHPFYQDKDMAKHIFKHVRKRYNRKQPVLLDCWAGNEKLFEFYRKHECNFLGDYPEKDYKISVFQVGSIYDDR